MSQKENGGHKFREKELKKKAYHMRSVLPKFTEQQTI